MGNQQTLKTNYLKFFCSLFRRVHDELEKCQKELSEKEIVTAEDLAKWWSSHFESIRTKLYKAAIEGSDEPIEVCTLEYCKN